MSVSEITETRQYLTFKLGNEIFATDVAKVREVLDLTTITQIPRTPDFMAGVINLRGSVVPVVDLRLCFEMSKTESTRNTCIVVVEVLLDNESTIIGALTDSVEEVIDLEPDQIQPATEDRNPDPDRLHQGDGEARHAVHHDPGHRSRLFGRGAYRRPQPGRRQTGSRQAARGEEACG
jgi:purine-binding chemotaxis protein CheW